MITRKRRNLSISPAKQRLWFSAPAGAERSPPRGRRHCAVFAPVRNRVECASESEARARSRRSGPSVDEIESSLHGQTLARLDCCTDSRTFRGVAPRPPSEEDGGGARRGPL